MSKTRIPIALQHHHFLCLLNFYVRLTEVPWRAENLFFDELGNSTKCYIGFFTVELVCTV